MTIYEDIFALYQSTVLRRRLTVAIAVAARNVFGEAPATANHANRLIWANAAILDAPAWAERMMWGLLSDNTVRTQGEAATDAQVQSALNAAIDTYATG